MSRGRETSPVLARARDSRLGSLGRRSRGSCSCSMLEERERAVREGRGEVSRH